MWIIFGWELYFRELYIGNILAYVHIYLISHVNKIITTYKYVVYNCHICKQCLQTDRYIVLFEDAIDSCGKNLAYSLMTIHGNTQIIAFIKKNIHANELWNLIISAPRQYVNMAE